jgi:mono/diheme cytochrome c family protein
LARAVKARAVVWTIGIVAIAALIALAATWRPPIGPIDPRSPASFDAASVRRGAGLAHLGYCTVCHTAPGGQAYAGGLALKTQFGLIYSSNITPDAETGIGRWSRAAFVRAMRDGVARNGSHLYPAFPYDHFTHATDADLSDLYAFLMTRKPVQARAPSNRLIPPLGFRPLLAGWKLLFLKTGPVPADPSRSPDWNRGRYLVESFSHCGGCHRPRNWLGAEERGKPMQGGDAEGWYAPPLDASSPAVRAWTAERMFNYLRTGLSLSHAAAAGPMGPVTRELSAAPESDVRAISVYVSSLMAGALAAKSEPPAPDHAEAAARAHPQGAALFTGACSGCHGPGAGMMLQGRPPLSLGTPLDEPTPRDAIQIVLQGLKPPVGRSGPYMPPFGDSLTDAQAAEIVAYLRARYSDQPPWPNLEDQVREARKQASP